MLQAGQCDVWHYGVTLKPDLHYYEHLSELWLGEMIALFSFWVKKQWLICRLFRTHWNSGSWSSASSCSCCINRSRFVWMLTPVHDHYHWEQIQSDDQYIVNVSRMCPSEASWLRHWIQACFSGQRPAKVQSVDPWTSFAWQRGLFLWLIHFQHCLEQSRRT